LRAMILRWQHSQVLAFLRMRRPDWVCDTCRALTPATSARRKATR